MESISIIKKDSRVLIFFMTGWLLLNMLQAHFTNIDGDEAYYWTYAQHLAWGYFDHPPMVALSVNLGELFAHGSLFTRLGTIIFSVGTIYFGFKALPQSIRHPGLYVLGYASVAVFHMYGFIATPDAALLFFTALFFYAYRLFLQKESAAHIIFLGLSITALLYSKYHGFLPVLFTFLSHPKLALKRSAWLVLFIALVTFLPHLYWQNGHNWATFRYHLSERIGSEYRIDKTTNYILGQALVWGPFTTIPALFYFIREKVTDRYLRSHFFNFFGIIVFFLLFSFRGTIEPHWTLSAGISFITLMQLFLFNAPAKTKRIFIGLMIANMVFLMTARLLFVLPVDTFKNVKAFRVQQHGRSLVDSVYKVTGNHPVIFADSYIFPSLYRYYHTGVNTSAYNTIYGRKNNFSLSTDEQVLNNKEVYVALFTAISHSDYRINNDYNPVYLHKLDSFRSVNGFFLKWLDPVKTGEPQSEIMAMVSVRNSGKVEISTGGLFLSYAFIQSKKNVIPGDVKLELPAGIWKVGEIKKFQLPLRFPGKTGGYKTVFTIIQPPLAGTLSSNYYKISVK